MIPVDNRPSEAAGQRPFENLPFLDAFERCVDRGPRRVGADAPRLDVLENTGPASHLQPERRPRAGQGGAHVVQGALALEPHERPFDFSIWKRPLSESAAKLRHRQLPPREQLKAGHIRIGSGRHGFRGARTSFEHDGRQKRSMRLDELSVVGDLAISSRARSLVVPIPCTLSLNSSTFEAQRNASSYATRPRSYRPKID